MYKFLFTIIFYLFTSPLFAKPSSVKIDSLVSSGSGCPQGTVASSIANDLQSFTLIFDRFEVENNGSDGRGRWHIKQKDCQVNLNLKVPGGWSLAIVSSQFRGFASLDEGVLGRLFAKYRTDRGIDVPMGNITLEGEVDDDYKLSHEAYISHLNWSGCSDAKPITFNTRLKVMSKDGDSTGLMTVDSFDSQIRQEYLMVWRQCQEPEDMTLAICRASLTEGNGHRDQPLREYTEVVRERSLVKAAKSASARALQACEKDRLGNVKIRCVLTCQNSNVGFTGLKIKAEQSFEQIRQSNNRSRFRWWIKLLGDDVNHVQKVDYYLHKSFGDKPFSKINKSEGFRFQATGYGGFLIRMKLHLRQGGFKWLYHRLALPPKSYQQIFATTSQSYTKRPISRGNGKNWYDWQVWIKSDDIEQIRCVTYTLHSSFDQRKVRKCDSSDGFRLKANGWGGFNVKISLELRNGSTQKLSHRLKLPK